MNDPLSKACELIVANIYELYKINQAQGLSDQNLRPKMGDYVIRVTGFLTDVADWADYVGLYKKHNILETLDGRELACDYNELMKITSRQEPAYNKHP